jgi:hypothetical protein
MLFVCCDSEKLWCGLRSSLLAGRAYLIRTLEGCVAALAAGSRQHGMKGGERAESHRPVLLVVGK